MDMKAAVPFFELDDVSKVFNVKRRVERRWLDRMEAAQVRAVNRVSLRIAQGETLAIVGESGSGKSTLANVMSRVTPASEGSMRLDGDELTTANPALLQAFRRRVQMVFQDPSSSLNPRQTVEDIVGLPLRLGGMRSRKERRVRVRELLESVQMPADTLLRTPMSLSGGQKQRINIARALALRPELLILDEPTSALDVSVQARILNLLAALKAQYGLTYVIITHDLGVVRAIADRIAVMYLGQVVETGTADEIMRRPRHPYTRALIGAIPVVHESDRVFIPATEVLDGETPSLLDPPVHCAFYSRCAFREDACRTRPAPALVADTQDHAVRCHRYPSVPSDPANRDLPGETT
ncbi:MAG: ABC transporter ATP-binding protein [Pseudomonadota bacterium]